MKSSRSIWTKNLDSLVSKITILRDGACVLAGTDCASEKHWTPKGSILTNGHVFSRKNLSVRWDIRPDGDCHTQCWGCNYRHVYDQYVYYNWYQKTFGQDRFEALRIESRTTRKWTISEMREYYVKLVSIYKDMVQEKASGSSSRLDEVRKLDDLVKSLYR